MTNSGWFADPTRRHRFRYWHDGAWTEHVSDGTTIQTDRLPAVVAPSPTNPPVPPTPSATTPAAGRRSSRRGWIIGASIGAGVLVLAGAVVGIVVLVQVLAFGTQVGDWFGDLREDNSNASAEAQSLAETIDGALDDGTTVSYFGGGATPTSSEWIHIQVLISRDADLARTLEQISALPELSQATGIKTQVEIRQPVAEDTWNIVALGQRDGGVAASAATAAAIVAEQRQMGTEALLVHLNDPMVADELGLLFDAPAENLVGSWNSLAACLADGSCPATAAISRLAVASSSDVFSFSADTIPGAALVPIDTAAVHAVIGEFGDLETHLWSDGERFTGGVCIPDAYDEEDSDALEDRASRLPQSVVGLDDFGAYGCDDDQIASRFGPPDTTGLTRVE